MVFVLEGILWLFRFAIGACIFSFLNAAAYRLTVGESILHGRSHCPGCGKLLTARELIPCVSYLAQRGKCLGCGMNIRGRYVWMEFAGGAAFVCCGLCFGCGEYGILSLRGCIAFIYLSILAVVALVDWDTRIIYDRFHIGILLLGAASLWAFPEHSVTDRFIGMFLVSVPMLLLAFLIAGAFGGGDIKLMAASGFLLGTKAICVAMFLGLLSGGVYCVRMMVKGTLSRKDSFAFGPFLAFGLAAAFFWGDQIAGWYLSLLR